MVALLIVLGEFAFLTGIYHMRDGALARRQAATRLAGALASAGPGSVPAVQHALDELLATGASGPAVLRVRTTEAAWAVRPSNAAALSRLRLAGARLVTATQESVGRVDRSAALISAALLVLVSVGWFAWFRRMLRRHRGLQRELTEKQALDAGERRLLALVQNSADLVAVCEPDTTITFVTPASLAVLGKAPEQIVGLRLIDLASAGDAPVLTQVVAAARDGDHDVEFKTTHADGRTLVLEGTLTNLLDDVAVGGWVLTVRDVTEQRELLGHLEHQAFHDELTGLANRQLFADRLGHALRPRTTRSEALTVLFLDLDDFKDVNDSFGHSLGDELLVEVAARIGGAVRPADTVARFGGDEYAVLMEETDETRARVVASGIQAALAAPLVLGGRPVAVQASMGMACGIPGRSTVEELLRDADVAMHWAKKRGKSTVETYDPGLHAQALARVNLNAELQRAIREGQFVLHYQATVELTTERIKGFEALVRWNHPQRGLLQPSDFMPVAEQSGLIIPLGRWILNEACRAAASLQSTLRRPTVAVNVAARQLADEGFVDDVLAALRSSRLAPDRLVLEVTETVLLQDIDSAVVRLKALRDLGVAVAIDDFGTGYSSLSYLSRLPVDVLKVDKSFVDKACAGAHDASLIEAIISMSRTMRLTTVAEGVERAEQADWLRNVRCAMGQGFLWSRPVKLARAAELLRDGLRPSRAALVDPRAALDR